MASIEEMNEKYRMVIKKLESEEEVDRKLLLEVMKNLSKRIYEVSLNLDYAEAKSNQEEVLRREKSAKVDSLEVGMKDLNEEIKRKNRQYDTIEKERKRLANKLESAEAEINKLKTQLADHKNENEENFINDNNFELSSNESTVVIKQSKINRNKEIAKIKLLDNEKKLINDAFNIDLNTFIKKVEYMLNLEDDDDDYTEVVKKLHYTIAEHGSQLYVKTSALLNEFEKTKTPISKEKYLNHLKPLDLSLQEERIKKEFYNKGDKINDKNGSGLTEFITYCYDYQKSLFKKSSKESLKTIMSALNYNMKRRLLNIIPSTENINDVTEIIKYLNKIEEQFTLEYESNREKLMYIAKSEENNSSRNKRRNKKMDYKNNNENEDIDKKENKKSIISKEEFKKILESNKIKINDGNCESCKNPGHFKRDCKTARNLYREEVNKRHGKSSNT